MKVGPDGNIDRFKTRLVANGYTQIFGLDYSDTFSLVAKMASVRLLFITAIQHWPLHQIDIKNAFFTCDLEEEVYMEQPPGFVARGSHLIWFVDYTNPIMVLIIIYMKLATQKKRYMKSLQQTNI